MEKVRQMQKVCLGDGVPILFYSDWTTVFALFFLLLTRNLMVGLILRFLIALLIR